MADQLAAVTWCRYARIVMDCRYLRNRRASGNAWTAAEARGIERASGKGILMAGAPPLIRGRRLLGWRSVAARLSLALVAALPAAAALPSAAHAATTAPAQCLHATGPFHVVGNEVLGHGGQVFVPYGITVPGLANFPVWKPSVSRDLMKIRASAKYWCANTVRLQVSQDNLLGTRGRSFNRSYLNAIKTEVWLAESLGLVVVLNDQTETAEDPDTKTQAPIEYQKGPTRGTETFWRDMTTVFGNDKQVIFDLFNEPRDFNSPGITVTTDEWHRWLNGGTFEGNSYLGMSALVHCVQGTGTGALCTGHPAHNVLWVEGPKFSSTFAGIELANSLIKDARNIVYAIHHPAGPHTEAEWHNDFAFLTITGVAPVVVGEWTNYRPFPGKNPECWAKAPKQVPVFLRYLQGHGIGMTGYQLSTGLLVTGDSSIAAMSHPTTLNFGGRKWSCSPKPRPTNQGAGRLIMNWYHQNNS